MNPYERWDDWEWEEAVREMGRQRKDPYNWRSHPKPRRKNEFLYNWTGMQQKAIIAATLFLTIFFGSRGDDLISKGVYRIYQTGMDMGNAYAVLNNMAKDIMVTSGVKQEAIPVDSKMVGKFVPPISGPVMAKFGVVSEEGQSAIHQGIDVGSALGVPVVSPYKGVVTEIGEHPQLGKVVKINFGDGWSSVYGNLGDIQVKAGQPVEMGDVIGKVGLSAPVKKPWLHFELHKNGKPVDPLPYLVPTVKN